MSPRIAIKYIRLYFSSLALSVLTLLMYFVAAMILSFEIGVTSALVLDIVYWLFVAAHLALSFLFVFRVDSYTTMYKLLNVALTLAIYIAFAMGYEIVL